MTVKNKMNYFYIEKLLKTSLKSTTILENIYNS